MNLLQKLFGKKSVDECDQPNDINVIDEHEQLLINKVIEILKTNPECFSARWFNGSSLDSSVRSNDRQILIMINTGQITFPITPKMSKKQKEMVKQLIEPIVKKDSVYLIEKLCCIKPSSGS